MYPRRWVMKQSRRLAFILARRIMFRKNNNSKHKVSAYLLKIFGICFSMGSPCPWARKQSCLASAWKQIRFYCFFFFYGSEEESVDVLESHHLSLITVKARIMRTTHSEVRVEGDDVRCKTALQSSNKPSASNPILKQQYFLQIIVKKMKSYFLWINILRQ